MKPNFPDMAREWLVRAQGHARPEHEKSLAAELERVWALGVANAIEAADNAECVPERVTKTAIIDAMRDLVVDKSREN